MATTTFDEEDSEPQEDEDTFEDTEEGEKGTQSVTQHAHGRGRAHARGERSRNAAVRQHQALQLRALGHTFEEIAAKVGYSHKSVALRAVRAAMKAIGEETAAEARAGFLASYGPVRQALHKLARTGDPRAVEALVKLDERQCKLFGLDLAPADPALSMSYSKRIILEDHTTASEVLVVVPSENGHNGNGHVDISGSWPHKGQHTTLPRLHD